MLLPSIVASCYHQPMSATGQPSVVVGVVPAVLAALFFGASTPAVKALSTGGGPNAVAALLYMGSGVGLLLVLLARRARGGTITPIPRAAWSRFSVAIFAGGVVAPALLVLGLKTTAASTSSLLLNTEGVLTAVIAWVVFRENVDRRVLLGMTAIVLGGIALAFDGGAVVADVGALFIVGACAGWAIDNNLTQGVSSADPLLVASIKGLAAGAVNAIIALVLGQTWGDVDVGAAVLVVGFVGYGVSLSCFVLALRHLGTARTGAYFGAAPFVGAALSIAWLGEPVTAGLVVGAVLMLVGLCLHLTEHHEHEHEHEALDHDHEHVHDEHHQHAHDTGIVVVGAAHSHRHRHAPLVHGHAHTPDLHHRHTH